MKLFKESKTLSLALLKEKAGALFLLFCVTTLITYNIIDTLPTLGPDQEETRVILQIGTVLLEIIEGAVLFLLLSFALPNVRSLKGPNFAKKPFSEPYLNSFLAEYLRVLAQTLLWALALLLPGFYRYCRLSFVPYIALFCKPYRDDKVDAVQLSLTLTSPRIRRIVAVVLGTSLAANFIDFLPQLSVTLHALPIRVLCSALAFWVTIQSYALLYLIFENALEEHKWT